MTASAVLAAGFYAATLVNKRILFLKSCISLINQFSVDIGYCSVPLDILFKNASDNSQFKHLSFITEVAKNMSDDFSVVWKTAVNSFFLNNMLPNKDKQLLLSFGEKLGTTDCEHQLKLCDEYITRLNESYDEALHNKNERIKLLKSLSVVGALLITVLFV